MYRKLIRQYESVDDTTVQAGRAWYPDAWDTCVNIADRASPLGVGPTRIAGVVAALSPRTRWKENVTMAREASIAAWERQGLPGAAPAIRRATSQAFPTRREKVVEILVHLKHPGDMTLGPKCDAFWRAIANDEDAVMVDSWVAKGVGIDPARLTPRVIQTIQKAYRLAADAVNESPRDLQAILWVNIRGSAS